MRPEGREKKFWSPGPPYLRVWYYQEGRDNFEVGMKRGLAKYTEPMELLFNSFDLLLPLISVKLSLQQITSTQHCQDAIYDFIDRNEENLDIEVGNVS